MTGRLPADPATGQKAPQQGRHGWMMIVCCIPMLAIGVVLVATGVLRPRFLIFAVGCTAMMALMMRGMNHGGMNHGGMDHGGSDQEENQASHAGHDRQGL